MTDRELLELAAKAAGYLGVATEYPNGYAEFSRTDGFSPRGSNVWNPLTDDGDALRLAVALDIPISSESVNGSTWVCKEQLQVMQPHRGDPYAATRRAIVRAAAEIGWMAP